MAPTKPNKGVTLVELLISIVIILIVGLACIQILQGNSRASVSMLKRIQASQYLDQIHNQLLRSNIEKLGDHYLKFPQIITSPDFSAEVRIQKPDDDGIRLANIAVRWRTGENENSISDDVTLTPR